MHTSGAKRFPMAFPLWEVRMLSSCKEHLLPGCCQHGCSQAPLWFEHPCRQLAQSCAPGEPGQAGLDWFMPRNWIWRLLQISDPRRTGAKVEQDTALRCVAPAAAQLLRHTRAAGGSPAGSSPGLPAAELLQPSWHCLLLPVGHSLFSLEPLLAPLAFPLEAPVISAFGCGNSCREEFCHHLWGYSRSR